MIIVHAMIPCKVCSHDVSLHNIVHGDPEKVPIQCKGCLDGFCVPRREQ